MERQTVLSGIRATGKLHLGNYFGAIKNFVRMQDEYNCFFFVADYHTLTTSPDPEELKKNLPEIVMGYLAAGLDPQKCILFAQSSVPEVAELALLLSMLMPMGELQRCPTFKEKARSQPENVNLGLLSYPVLMAADILSPKADWVPVGKDQLPHIEMTQTIAKKFNKIYGKTFPIPRALKQKAIKVPGLDGKEKMGKSDNNTIDLTETPENIRKKISSAFTDPSRVYRNDPGNPTICCIYELHMYISSGEEIDYVKSGCKSASIGCVECKNLLGKGIIKVLEPFQERYSHLSIDYVTEVLKEGGKKARVVAQETIQEVRNKMGLTNF